MAKRLAAIGLLAFTSTACGSRHDGDAVVTGVTTEAVSTCTGDFAQVDSPNVGSGDNVLASVSGVGPNDVWAVGQYAPDANPNMTLSLALHYDGSAWSVVDTPNVGPYGNALLGVTARSGGAWSVGYYIGNAFLSRSLIEAWDGTAWHIVQHPQPFETENLYGTSSVSRRDVWAVGSGRNGQGAFHTLALHFDGFEWSVVPTVNPGSTGNVLYGVTAVSANDVWAVGQKIGDAGPDQALVEHWNGFSWSEVPVPHPSDASTQFIGVTSADEAVRAVGDAQDGVVSLRTFAEARDHRTFSIVDTANPSVRDDRLAGVALLGDTWAVGNYIDEASGSQSTLIERSDGHAWVQVSSPNPSSDGDNQLAAVAATGANDLLGSGSLRRTGRGTDARLASLRAVVSSPVARAGAGGRPHFQNLTQVLVVPTYRTKARAMNLFKLVTGAHVWLYRSSGGKRGARMKGKDIVLLTTKGRKTGADRTVPVVSFVDGQDRVVIASKGGAPEHPAWFLNLEKNPDVTVQLGPEIYRAKAVISDPTERDRLFQKAVSEMPQFGEYEKKTNRVIPVVRLVRAA